MLDDKKKSSGGGIHHPKDQEKVQKKLKASLQRLNATLKLEQSGKEMKATVVSIDLKETGANITVPESLERFQTVRLIIHEPQKVEIRGVVQWSGTAPDNRGIKRANKGAAGYRAGLQFIHEHEQQKAVLAAFIEMMMNRYDNPMGLEINPGQVEGEDEEIGAKKAESEEAGEAAAKTDAAAGEAGADGENETKADGEAAAGAEATDAVADAIDDAIGDDSSDDDGSASEAA